MCSIKVTSVVNFVSKILILCTLVIPLSYSYAQQSNRIAILPFKDNCKPPVGAFKIKTLTESLRTAAVQTGSFYVMTKENIKTMLDENVNIEDCIGSCEVETGRNLNVNYIATAEIGRFDNQYELIIRLHETQGGTLLNQISLSAATIPLLRTQIKQNAISFFSKVAQLKLQMNGAQQSKSSLYLLLSPTSAKVKIDGAILNLQDFTQKNRGYLIPIPAGKHRVESFAEGYTASAQEVVIPRNGIATIELNLFPAIEKTNSDCDPKDPQCIADLYIYTTPANAAIYIDGKNIKKRSTPVQGNPKLGAIGLQLKPGTHIIEARASRYVTARRKVVLKNQDFDQSMKENPIVLTPNFGRVKIQTQPREAVITLDGKMVSQISPWSSELLAGAHRLRIIAPNHLPYEEVLVVERGKMNQKSIRLTPSYSNVIIKVKEEGSTQAMISQAQVIVNQDLQNPYQTDERGYAVLNQVDQGEVSIQVIHPLFNSQTRSVKVKSGGKKQSFTIELEPNYAYVSLASQGGIKGEAFLDSGQSLGQLPIKKRKVAVGNMMILIRPDQTERYSTWRKKIALELKEHRALNQIKLKERLGTLIVNAQPLGSDVYLDGKKIGTSPLKKRMIQGVYRLKIKAAQYDPYIEEITVPEGKRLMKTITLGQNPVIEVHCTPHYAEIVVNGKRLGRSPQTYTQRPGQWKLSCMLPSREGVYKTIRTRDSQQERVYLSVDQKDIQAFKTQVSRQKWLMWGSMVLGSALLVTSGIYGFKTQSAIEERDLALETWKKALTIDELQQADDQFTQASDNTSSYSLVSNATLVSGSLFLLYSAYAYFTLPSLKKAKAKRKRSVRHSKSTTMQGQNEHSWHVLPMLDQQSQGLGMGFSF